MSTDQTTTTMPTPGIAGRYFVQERRERFNKLVGRVYVEFENGQGYYSAGHFIIENEDILSPRRLYRKFVDYCDSISQYPIGSQNNIVETINDLTDAAFTWMRQWSLDGFPAPQGRYFYRVLLPLTKDFWMEMNLWESDTE